MTAAGLFVGDLTHAIDEARRVYECFYDNLKLFNIPSSIRKLAKTTKSLHDLLNDFKKLFDQYGVVYMRLSTLTRRLDECSAFIAKYSELRQIDPAQTSGRTIKKGRRVWQTYRSTFNHSSDQLNADLCLEMGMLMIFIVDYAL
jgi:hypothetical protein